jgi:phosphoribosyl-ATP pyrophosphohydrolase
MDPSVEIFRNLMAVVAERKAQLPEGSYTTALFRGGLERIGAKLREESAEAIEAAGEPGDAGRDHLVREAADVIYHLFVLLGHREVPLVAVEQELARRFGISGLAEKASRAVRNPPTS